MPTYAYRCADCGYSFDVHQAFTDDALTVCPQCSGTLRKQFSSVGVVFKGPGFYRTDSRASSRSATVPAESGSSSSADSGKSSDSAGSSDSGKSSGSGDSSSTPSTVPAASGSSSPAA